MLLYGVGTVGGHVPEPSVPLVAREVAPGSFLQAELSPVTPEPCSWLPASNKEQVKELVSCFADFYDLARSKVLCIVKRESGFNSLAKNPHSTASGSFQFLSGTYRNTVVRFRAAHSLDDSFSPSVWDAYWNVRLGAWKMAQDGYSAWVISPSCS